MKYPPLSDSLILPPIDNIYVYASYKTQSYEAYKKEDNTYTLIGQLSFASGVNCLNEREILDKWLQDVGYLPGRKKEEEK